MFFQEKKNIKPVYMINGFLESGKTDFIGFTADLSDQIRHDFMQI